MRTPDARAHLELLTVGVVSILGQVTLLRELMVAFYGSELIVILAIGILLPASALGVVFGKWSAKITGGETGRALIVFAIALPLLAVFLRSSRLLFGATRGAYLPFFRQIGAATAVLVPFGFLTGLLFHHAATSWLVSGRRERSLAAAYAVESAGGLIGGALVTVLMAAGLSNFASLILCALAAAVAALFSTDRRFPVVDRGVKVFSAVAILLLLVFSGPLDRRLTALNHPGFAASEDTPYGRITVTKLSKMVSIFENDALVYESQETGAEVFVNLAALQVKRPERVLVLGGGPRGLVSELLKQGPKSVTDVELDRRAFRMALSLLPRGETSDFEDGRVDVRFADPRRFLKESVGRWDLILVGMPGPDSGSTNRFYTGEFFAACARRLNPGGVLAFRLRSSENFWTPALTRRNAGIYRALTDAFPHAVVYPGTSNVVAASLSPLTRDPSLLAQRFRERGIQARLVCPAYIRYVLTNDRFAGIEKRLKSSKTVANSDERPVCYLFTIVLWLSRFFPSLGAAGFSFAAPAWSGLALPWAVAAVVLCLIFFVLSRSATLKRVALAAVAGFWGMVLEGAVMLGFQARNGALYFDMGLLFAAFMGGLASGSMVFDALFSDVGKLGRFRGTGRFAAIGLSAMVALLVAELLRSGSEWGLVAAFAVLFIVGFLVGALFASASLGYSQGQTSAVSPLYAADLAGGAAGSVGGALFLLPVLGLPASSLIAAALSVAALVLLL